CGEIYTMASSLPSRDLPVAASTRRIAFDPMREGLQEFLQERARRIAYERALVVEQSLRIADVGLGLRHHRDIEKDHRLPQVVIRAERPQRAGRNADDGTRLSI